MLTLSVFLLAALILSAISLKSTYGILKFFAGVLWIVVFVLWIGGSRPTFVTAGSPADNIIILVTLGTGLAMMFMPWWYDSESKGMGRFRLPFTSPEENEQRQTTYRHPSRAERISNYRQRANNAIRGIRD